MAGFQGERRPAAPGEVPRSRLPFQLRTLVLLPFPLPLPLACLLALPPRLLAGLRFLFAGCGRRVGKQLLPPRHRLTLRYFSSWISSRTP